MDHQGQPEYTPLYTRDNSLTLIHPRYKVPYHSIHGAITESRHVFIHAGLLYQLEGRDHLSILDMGFGTGLNALLTFLVVRDLPVSITYTAVDLAPPPWEVVADLKYPEALGAPEALHHFKEIHEAAEEGAEIVVGFKFKNLTQDIRTASLDESYDLIYHDAFAPKVQPELWEKPLLSTFFHKMTEGGCLVTYCAQGRFKRNLRSVGFTVESLPGPPGKREMVRAFKLTCAS